MSKERPAVDIKNKMEVHLAIELFQNVTLRPVLKLQHELILKLFHSHIDKLSINWNELNKLKQSETVNNQFIKNIQIRNLILGVIVGQLDEVEIEKYLIDCREYNKRIIQMTIQRIISTL